MWYTLHCSYMCYSFSVGLCERDLYQSKHFTFAQVLTKSHKRTVPPPVFLHQRIFSQASGMHCYRTSWSSLICKGFKADLWMCDMPTHRKTVMPKQVSERTKSLSGFLSWCYSARRGKSRIWSEKNTLESVVQSMKENLCFSVRLLMKCCIISFLFHHWRILRDRQEHEEEWVKRRSLIGQGAEAWQLG